MKRKIVRTKNEYTAFVKAQNNRTNVYTTVYDFEHFSEMSKIDSSVILDRIFLDFDAHGESLDNAFEDLKMVMEYVITNDIQHSCFFSGRGFHLFLHGEVTDNIRDIQAYFRIIKKYLKNNTNYEITLDDRVGQSTRLRRVPNTVNMSSRNEAGIPYYCIPIFYEDLARGLSHILKLAERPRLIPKRITGKEKISWPKSKPLEAVKGEVVATVFKGRLPILPCLHSAIMVENPSHMARAYLVSWYRDLLSGCSKGLSNSEKQDILDKVVEEIKWIAETHDEVWLDWDEGETRKHARFTVFGEYTAPHCKTKLIPEGYCIGKCWRYPHEVKQ
tara:strand:- start:5471 stop:6463 length:993 start_codon:yes stop_codon:yes gene_type:complete